MKYVVEYDTNYDKFMRRVEHRLDNGWELVGGCNHNNGLFVQALIKKEPAVPKDTPAGATAKTTKKKVTKKKVGPRKPPRNTS